MSPYKNHERQHIIKRITDLVEERLAPREAEQVQLFALQYYAASAIEDLHQRSIDDLYGAMLAQWRLARQRRPGQVLVRVYNPDFEQHGWQSTHTVFEVVADDMPFLVDSLSMLCVRLELTTHLVIHPVIDVLRDGNGLIQQLLPRVRSGEGQSEAMLHFEVDRQTDDAALALLQTQVEQVLGDVGVVVQDWGPMRAKIEEIIPVVEAQALPVPPQVKQEALAFLRWIANHHFTFVGFRAYDLVQENGQDVLRLVPGSGLGILRESEADGGRASHSFAHIPPPLRKLARQRTLLIITKSTAVSTVHRPVHLDYIGIKRYNGADEVVGEWRFLGLYGSAAYSARPADVPILRRKFDAVMEKAGFAVASHDRKALQHILETFPRDEMFQFTEDELLDVALGILQVRERHKLGLFLRRDLFGRFVTALVYVPRDRYDTHLRQRIQEILMQALDGQGCEFNIQLSESPLARVHFIIRTRPDTDVNYDEAELRALMTEAMVSWQDALLSALHEELGEARATRLFERYGEAFPHAYRDDYPARTAVHDIQRLESINDRQPLAMHLYRPPESGDELLRFKVFGREQATPLSDIMPMLERMGLRVLSARPYQIETRQGDYYWTIEFDMLPAFDVDVEVLTVKDFFQEAFARVCSGEMENDGFNRLVLAAALNWREVVLLRAMCKYLLQTRMPFSQAYMENALASHPDIARQLVALFAARFSPSSQQDAERSVQLTGAISAALGQVANLDEDRILRSFLTLVQAMLRSNYYQRDGRGHPKPYLSFKLDSRELPMLPQPRPMFEIFIYSPRVEGVHLRGGPVARGGLRWSDRREDFRTEILGLMKAQMVKNAVIVPVGAKGGFVPKQLPGTEDRDALQVEVIECYKTFIRGLLDITDNLVDGAVVTPKDVVRHDGDDPYLVVAADKGTASFSDIANGLSQDYGFWLGDAFASGGSAGYDHKKMGITARGAWESVKRHFRELGLDTQTEPFSVAGIGDMAGDVFGNGMLLSPQIKLVAAFNHLHIFIDPAPDPAASFSERQRLFNLSRSSWTDYDAELISDGGGVYSRRAKAIPLSDAARKALGTDATTVTPNELIRIILQAPVDLLWNGGIGTYVKASSEPHSAADDRSNDALRVDAAELRCRVVGEGGNLGFTQSGRVEYALNGGRINTDAIDNSGGVDCSDHEVNIKILLDQVVSGGDMTLKQRNQLLVEMTDEVARLVLKHNYLQSQAISIAAIQAPFLLSDHARFIRRLEKEGRLQRTLEALPDDERIAEREAHEHGLTRPEIAVLIAYSKVRLFEELVASDVTRDPYLSQELIAYFPGPVQQRFVQSMEQHPLKHEIIATRITDNLVNRMGGSFWTRTQETTGDHAADIARAYTVAREVFQIEALWGEIETLDNQVGADTQLHMLIESRRLLDRATLWLLRNRRPPLGIAETIAQFRPAAGAIAEQLTKLLHSDDRKALRERIRPYTGAGVAKPLALRIAGLETWYAALDITAVAADTDVDVMTVAELYFALSSKLELHWLAEQVKRLPRLNPWQRKARTGLLDELNNELRALTLQVLSRTDATDGTEARIKTWSLRNRLAIEHCHNVFAEIRAGGKAELAMLTVAMRELRALSYASGGTE
ncbi:NAD-glutamate dehydrogenase [Candidatus Tenderia electrophaga]|jgi:glutamate dehydrogenase|uniref:NAD-glutamate dehydrogenase n=1 Tax=Candidatus Tenderia electrophaga TaxID=1748243 RepID=A0A0S2T9S0_9GAMM|nr:NAD-glutamate dehydrogenase [Candidatus Tenderia electrophaga]